MNLGCGTDLKPGFVNVDLFGKPDVRLDLNAVWPWKDRIVKEVLMLHVLEHLPDTVHVMKELYRVCENKAKVLIRVPHPRHDDFLSDPTHVRPINVKLMKLFSKRMCLQWQKGGFSDTPLALIHNVDFEVIDEQMALDDIWLKKVNSGAITVEQVREFGHNYNNVYREIEMTLKVCK